MSVIDHNRSVADPGRRSPEGRVDALPVSASEGGPARTTIAIIGAGKLGTVLARLAVHAGHRVLVAASGAPDSIRLILDVLAPGSEPAWVVDAVQQADVVILALPLSKLIDVPLDPLNGKLVIDAMNYWWEVDGERPDLEDLRTSTSEQVQVQLPRSIVVKAFNHVGYHDLDEGARPAGVAGRRAIAVAGDDSRAVATVAALVDAWGFDPVVAGSLRESIRLEPHAEAFGANVSAEELRTFVERFPTTARGSAAIAARS